MKNKKTTFRFFTIPQWKQEQEYLQEEHNNGWKFDRITFLGFYHFEKCEPEDVVYQLDYNADGIKHKREYVQLFNDCGWEYIQDFVGYSYFRKPISEMNGEQEEIFCDDNSRLDMIRRVFRGRMLPLLIIFLCIIIPNIFLQAISPNPYMLYFFAVLGIFYLILFIAFGYQYWKCRKLVDK